MGYAVGGLVLVLSLRKAKLATEGMGIIALAGVGGGILGAKLSQFILEGWPFKIPATSILDPRLGGKALFGGVLIGWLAVELTKRRLGIKRSTGDHFALALPAGEAVGRVGCLLNGCCFGKECDLPWAIHQHGADRHPTQLYSLIAALGSLALLIWVKPKLVREGDLFKVYLGVFGVTRFVIEFFRATESRPYGLTVMQWVCIELVVYASIALALSARRLKTEAAT